MQYLILIRKGNGTVYVYQYTQQFNGLSLQSVLKAPLGSLAFGWSLQIANDLILVSARRTGGSGPDTGFDNGYGSAYMYEYNSLNGWKSIQSFSQIYSSNFGNSLTMLPDASFFAVGAPSFYGNVGYVFVYIKNNQNTWILQQTITSPVSNSVDFGR